MNNFNAVEILKAILEEENAEKCDCGKDNNDKVRLQIGKDAEAVRSTITYVKDRPGHDKRYAIDCTKAKSKLGWERKMTFEQGLLATIKWYLNHGEWISHIQSGDYKNWISKNYTEMGR